MKGFYIYPNGLRCFLPKIETYAALSTPAKEAWARLLRKTTYKKGHYFVTEGQMPKKIGFVLNGLMYQYYAAENGDLVIKYFFRNTV